jgi:hypothetical protein
MLASIRHIASVFAASSMGEHWRHAPRISVPF